MDLVTALPKWTEMGNTTKSYHDEHGNYTIDFINKQGKVAGWVKVYAGEGIRWSYPDELFSA